MDSSRPRAGSLIIGGFGGIGSALAAELERREPEGLVLRSSRQPPEADGLRLDLEDPDSMEQLAAALPGVLQTGNAELRRILVCSGTLHAPEQKPERRLADLQAAAFQRVMNINALGPLLLARALTPLLAKDSPTMIAAVSARVGSIGDNRLGGWYSYRCSKAALNMGFRTLAHELRRTHPQCTPLLYHPGTVDTALSAPFTRQPGAQRTVFSPAQAAGYFADVIAAHSDTHELAFVDWKNTAIDW